MGQYYVAVTSKKADFSERVCYNLQTTAYTERKENHDSEAYKYYNGIKLTEHSWVGNSFTDAFSRIIYKHPQFVAWVGDYANTETGSAYERLREHFTDGDAFVKSVWNDDAEEKEVTAKYSNRHFNYKGKYLLNHTTKKYIPLDGFAYDETEWIMYPVSLLTAVGNGLGGGDYQGTDEYKIGSWAFDEISIDTEVPEGFMYEEIPNFHEDD